MKEDINMTNQTVSWITENAMNVLKERYLLPKENGDFETVEELFERVTFGNKEYLELLTSQTLLPNSPTLFNAGTDNGGTSSACFHFVLQDSMMEPSGIIDVGRKAAAVLKAGGGVGYAFGNLRAEGSPIRTTHGKACGVVRVMRHYQSLAYDLITQGGKRPAAQMAILPWDHPEIEGFIACKNEDPEVLNTFNISVALTDDFMKAVFDDPESEEAKLLRRMTAGAWKTGDPGCYFIDTAERGNPTPWLGKLEGTNPCGEVPLLDNEPCNLASLNLTKFINYEDKAKPSIDFEALAKASKLAIRYLNEILDRNEFTDPAITKAAYTTRKLGLGVMGWADMQLNLKIRYDSNESVELGERIMSAIQTAAWSESTILADEIGPFPGVFLHPEIDNPKVYRDAMDDTLSSEDKLGYKEQLKELGLWRRNATLTCIAPTGTIAILAGLSQGIEPHFSLKTIRTTAYGAKLIEEVKSDDFIPPTSHEISYEWHIKHQEAFQKSTDLAVSKTINMPNSATEEDIFKAYVDAYKKGCKGVTVYRDGSRTNQVLVTERGHRKISERAIRHKYKIGTEEGYLHIGSFEDDGSFAEFFARSKDMGGIVEGLMDTMAILWSIAIQAGVPLERILAMMKKRKFEPSGFTGVEAQALGINSVTSIPNYIARVIEKLYSVPSENESEDKRIAPPMPAIELMESTKMTCPLCSGEVYAMETCFYCINPTCAWSQC